MDILCSDKTGTLTTANITCFPNLVAAYSGFTPQQVRSEARRIRSLPIIPSLVTNLSDRS
jgi:hypothetical protein